MSLGNERECFASSVSRTRGAMRLAQQDADRSAWLDAHLDEWRLEATEKRILSHLPARVRRDRRKKAPGSSRPARPATFRTGTGGDKGGGP